MVKCTIQAIRPKHNDGSKMGQERPMPKSFARLSACVCAPSTSWTMSWTWSASVGYVWGHHSHYFFPIRKHVI
jgi:hypothetical protein